MDFLSPSENHLLCIRKERRAEHRKGPHMTTRLSTSTTEPG